MNEQLIYILPFAFPSSTSVPMWTGKQLAWKGSLTITLEDKNRAALNCPAFFYSQEIR